MNPPHRTLLSTLNHPLLLLLAAIVAFADWGGVTFLAVTAAIRCARS